MQQIGKFTAIIEREGDGFVAVSRAVYYGIRGGCCVNYDGFPGKKCAAFWRGPA